MKKIVLGLTGGMGSGKSTALALFRSLGCRVADADSVVHGALAVGGRAYTRVRRLFPEAARPGGGLDRARIAAAVFRDPARRRRLERVLHPIVIRDFRRLAADLKRGCLVLDIPLLYEARLEGLVDRVVVVWAPRTVRAGRAVKAGWSRADFLRRDKAQAPLAEKRRRADFVIDNSGPVSKTRAQVVKLLQRFVT